MGRAPTPEGRACGELDTVTTIDLVVILIVICYTQIPKGPRGTAFGHGFSNHQS